MGKAIPKPTHSKVMVAQMRKVRTRTRMARTVMRMVRFRLMGRVTGRGMHRQMVRTRIKVKSQLSP